MQVPRCRPRDSDLIGRGCGLGFGIFSKCPCPQNCQSSFPVTPESLGWDPGIQIFSNSTGDLDVQTRSRAVGVQPQYSKRGPCRSSLASPGDLLGMQNPRLQPREIPCIRACILSGSPGDHVHITVAQNYREA